MALFRLAFCCQMLFCPLHPKSDQIFWIRKHCPFTAQSRFVLVVLPKEISQWQAFATRWKKQLKTCYGYPGCYPSDVSQPFSSQKSMRIALCSHVYHLCISIIYYKVYSYIKVWLKFNSTGKLISYLKISVSNFRTTNDKRNALEFFCGNLHIIYRIYK